MSKQPIDFKKFPTTRYQGSKRKMLPWIYEALKPLRFTTALDACGGSGSVSYLLKRMGKEVTYNDKLRFNYMIGKAIIENNRFKLAPHDINNIKRLNPDFQYTNFISETFRDIYYPDCENTWLDRAIVNIINMNHYQPHVLEYKKALSYYCIIQASLIKRPFNLFHRNNLYLRTNEVERNFGNKTTWDKSFDTYLEKFANEVNQLVFASDRPCLATNFSIFDIDPYGYELVYLDLPYIKKSGANESSNYLKCYHFLEGLANYQNWGDMIDYSTVNKRLKDIESQNDFNKDNIYETVENLFFKFRNSKLVFSYKKGGAPSIEFIKKAMSKIKRNVYTVSMHYKYALYHGNNDTVNNREVLIIGI